MRDQATKASKMRDHVRWLVKDARALHRQKNNGSLTGCALTVDKVLQKITDLGGWCGISSVLPLSVPFISIVDLPGTTGYGVGGWTVCASIFNLPCRPIPADFKMLGQGKIEYRVTDAPRPAKVDDATGRPVKPDDGREWVICSVCCACWVMGDKHRCQDCSSWYDTTMDGHMSSMVNEDCSLEMLRTMLEAQGGRCAVSGLPFARGVKEGERYSPFAISLDRLDNNWSHDDNVRLVCALFNPPDLNHHEAGAPWTRTDVEILIRLLRENDNK